MRVLMTADAVGGVWTYAVELALALAPHDVQVHLAVMGGRLTPAQQCQAGAFASLQVSELPLEWMPDPWDGVELAGRWLLEVERDVAPDLVHLNGFVHGVLPWRVPVLVVAHSDVLSWWRAVKGEPAPASWDTYRSRVTAGLQVARAVVAPTVAVAADLEREYGVAATSVIANCRELSLPLTVKESRVLAAGRVWDEAKGLDLLDAVAARLPWPVAIAGEQGGQGELPPRHAQVLGRLAEAELQAEFARSAVFAAPSRYEPFGLAAVEAGLAGCAVVVGDLPSQHEVWGDAASYAADEASLEHALRELLSDPQLAAARGAEAAARAGTYTRKRCVAGYLRQYSQLLAGVPA